METLSKNKAHYLRKFLQKKTRKRERKCLIEGEKLCLEALHYGFEIEALVYALGEGKRLRQVLAHPGTRSTYKTTSEALQSFSEVETPQGAIGLVSIPVPEQNPGESNLHKRYVALDMVSDPGNAGTIFRTASWFGWDGVLCGNGCVEVLGGKVIRSSMGAVFHIPIWENVPLPETLALLKDRGFTVFGSVPHFDASSGNPHRKQKPDERKAPAGFQEEKIILVTGSESAGISDDVMKVCDRLISIQGYGKAESLNAAVSTGILLDRLSRLQNEKENAENST